MNVRTRERESVISLSPDCKPLTSRRLEPLVTVLIIMRVFARGTPLRCARVRVDALTVRLNAINAPLDSCRLRARYRGERSSNRINRFVAPLRSRETVHCVTVREGSPALESSSRFFLILPCPLCVVAIRERGVHRGKDGKGNAILFDLKRRCRRVFAQSLPLP